MPIPRVPHRIPNLRPMDKQAKLTKGPEPGAGGQRNDRSIFLQILALSVPLGSDNVGMRRWMYMAALGAFLLAIPLWGQRAGRGGMAMGVARGGYATHGSGFVGASRGGYWGGGRTFHGHYPYYPRRYPYYYPWRYPWGYRGYYGYPWSWGWYGVGWSDAGFDSYPAQSYPMDASTPPDNSSAFFAYQQQQIDRLNDDVARLRAQVPAPPAPEPPQIRASTVLVFGDHHREEIENYAIVDGTLWVFTQQRARKIPIAQLNVPATTKANADRGIDFRLPGH